MSSSTQSSPLRPAVPIQLLILLHLLQALCLWCIMQYEGNQISLLPQRHLKYSTHAVALETLRSFVLSIFCYIIRSLLPPSLS